MEFFSSTTSAPFAIRPVLISGPWMVKARVRGRARARIATVAARVARVATVAVVARARLSAKVPTWVKTWLARIRVDRQSSVN